MATLFFWRFYIFPFTLWMYSWPVGYTCLHFFLILIYDCNSLWFAFVPFPGFVESSPYVEKIKVFERYFTSQMDLYDKVSDFKAWFSLFPVLKNKIFNLDFFFHPQDEIERKGSILVDYKDLLSNKQISHTLPDLAKDLKEMPEKILDCLGVAIHQVSFVLRIYICVRHCSQFNIMPKSRKIKLK